MTNLCKDLNTLKLADLYKLEIVKYLYPLQNNKLSKSLHDDYFKISQVKFISLYVRFKNTQAGNSEKTMRSSKPTAPCSHTLKNT